MRSAGPSVDSVADYATGYRMLTALIVLLRSIGLLCRGHKAVGLESLALRQPLAALTRTRKRPQLRPTDRLFWILLAKAWQEGRGAVIRGQPGAGLVWCRQWVRRPGG